jgi:hypothetical protein
MLIVIAMPPCKMQNDCNRIGVDFPIVVVAHQSQNLARHLPQIRKCARIIYQDLDLSQYGEGDRRKVDPPVKVQIATWSAVGQPDWWVKERQQWLGRVRGPDGCQRWIKAVDLRPAKEA